MGPSRCVAHAGAYPFCFQTETGPAQAVVAFGRNGTVYYGYAGWDTSDSLSDWPIGTGGGWRGNVSVLVSRSSDMGDSWQTTVVRNARGLEGDAQENNRPVSPLVVDTTSGTEDIVYVGWTGTRRDGNKPMMAVSQDAGRTFPEPMDLTGTYFEDESVRQGMARAARQERTPSVAAIDFSWPAFTLDGRVGATEAAGPRLGRHRHRTVETARPAGVVRREMARRLVRLAEAGVMAVHGDALAGRPRGVRSRRRRRPPTGWT